MHLASDCQQRSGHRGARLTLPGLRRQVSIVLVVGVVVCGCSNDGLATSDLGAPEPTTTALVPDPALAHYPGGGFEPLAIIHGRLVADGPCLLVRSAGQDDLLAVWPPGATLDRSQAPDLVRSADGDVIAVVGEEQQMGGGVFRWGNPADPDQTWRDRCPTEKWAWLNPPRDNDPDKQANESTETSAQESSD